MLEIIKVEFYFIMSLFDSIDIDIFFNFMYIFLLLEIFSVYIIII